MNHQIHQLPTACERMRETSAQLHALRPLRINLIGKSNGVGLARDLELLREALERLGLIVTVKAIDREQASRRRSVWTQWWSRLQARRPRSAAIADVNIMLEHVWLQYLHEARTNVGVPNPEWFDRHDRRFLHYLDHVWAKTCYTEQLFRALGCATTRIGFDSYDRFESDVVKQRHYFHLAGKSTMKGTDRLLEVWSRHPEWPRLIVVQHKPATNRIAAPNIELRSGYMSDGELRRLQNECAFHLCLSRTEGWGHYIVEALSVGAVAVTLDAAPMDELVTAERGILVRPREVGSQCLAATYDFQPDSLEDAIRRTLDMTEAEREELGGRARAWFLANKAGFGNRLGSALERLVTSKASG